MPTCIWIPVKNEIDGQQVEIKSCAVNPVDPQATVTEVANTFLITPTSPKARITATTGNGRALPLFPRERGVCFSLEQSDLPIRVYHQDRNSVQPVIIGRIDSVRKNSDSGQGVIHFLLNRISGVSTGRR
jgi:hypothetical protein